MPVLGNNNSLCGDYGAQEDGPSFSATAGFVATLGKNRLDQAQIKQWSALGAYKTTLGDKLRVLAFDTDFVSRRYTNPCGTDDPGSHLLDWIASELQQAEAGQEQGLAPLSYSARHRRLFDVSAHRHLSLSDARVDVAPRL